MRICILGSGSKGNAAVVESHGRCFAIDCGLCKRDFFSRCQEVGIDPASIEAFFITHEHSDHTKGLGVVSRGLSKMGIHPQLITSDAIRLASRPIQDSFDYFDQRAMSHEDAFSVAGMIVHPFKTSHDAMDSFGFRIESKGDTIGFMTDTGVVTPQAHDALQGCRLLALETNHDEQMLKDGPYPYALKQRVAGDYGHLSNSQSAHELGLLLCDDLEQVAAMHISENNNTYGIPVRALQGVFDRNDHPGKVVAALQHRAIVLE